ncbi:tRNA (adenine(22)-N(1))-methyltransferase TrmK [soil metagenome]
MYDAPVMRELSARLEAIVQSLKPCRLLADIGTDHGLVPIAAVLRGVAASAIASDLREAPLRVARRNIERAQLAGRVAIAQGDGLAALAGRGVDAIVVAGMSGETEVRLCSATPDVLRSAEQLVLQPNSGAHVVRTWARGAGWHLRDERMVATGGQFFVVCAFGKGGGRDPAYAMSGWPEAALDRLGPVLLARKDPVALRWCVAQRDRVRALIRDGAPGLGREIALWQAGCDSLA